MTSGLPYTAMLTGNTPNTARVSPVSSAPAAPTGCPSIERNTYHLPKTADVDLRVSRGFGIQGSTRSRRCSTSST